MNDGEIAAKVHSSMYSQCQKRGYATAVDVLMDLDVLKKEHYEDWRHGRVPYLERFCTVNLSKLSTIRHEMRVYAKKADLKPSICFYKQWAANKKSGQGKRSAILLRFSKSGREEIENQYATHYVDSSRAAQQKGAENETSSDEEEK